MLAMPIIVRSRRVRHRLIRFESWPRRPYHRRRRNQFRERFRQDGVRR